MKATKGNILIYFEKDSLSSSIQYGDQLLIFKSLQPVRNSGNPGSFDFQRYCAFRNTYHQVYLKQGEYITMKIKNDNVLKKFLFKIRAIIISILKKNISGNKEAGLAEAMLIGYKDDLDKNLVQAYSNTGVVHIIAISGLHLALIYWLLNLLVKPLSRLRKLKWLKPVIIISGLWFFSLAAGASPSVLRAALMFSCLVMGKSLSRSSSIYNSLAASAFLLLCINPYWLWDVGFQLSYAAVLSIVLFMKPIYDRFYFKNKAIDFCWQLLSVTTAAQILTAPVCLYHFHQFPNLFLVTNLVAVPLSTTILFGEIILCVFCWFTPGAQVVGWCLSQAIRFLNSFVELAGELPFALWQGLLVSPWQVLLLYLFIASLGIWWLKQKKHMLIAGLIASLGVLSLRVLSFWNASHQQKIIVYNIPRYQCIDFIAGRNFFFKGDSAISNNESLRNFHLSPSRILHRVSKQDSLPSLYIRNDFYCFGNKLLLIVDSSLQKPAQRLKVDLAVISNNAPVNIDQLIKYFDCQQVVIDGSNSPRKIKRWKADCVGYKVPCHSVTDEGAFVLTLH